MRLPPPRTRGDASAEERVRVDAGRVDSDPVETCAEDASPAEAARADVPSTRALGHRGSRPDAVAPGEVAGRTRRGSPPRPPNLLRKVHLATLALERWLRSEELARIGESLRAVPSGPLIADLLRRVLRQESSEIGPGSGRDRATGIGAPSGAPEGAAIPTDPGRASAGAPHATCALLSIVWERLHSGDWAAVEGAWRDAYGAACALRARRVLRDAACSCGVEVGVGVGDQARLEPGAGAGAVAAETAQSAAGREGGLEWAPGRGGRRASSEGGGGPAADRPGEERGVDPGKVVARAVAQEEEIGPSSGRNAQIPAGSSSEAASDACGTSEVAEAAPDEDAHLRVASAAVAEAARLLDLAAIMGGNAGGASREDAMRHLREAWRESGPGRARSRRRVGEDAPAEGSIADSRANATAPEPPGGVDVGKRPPDVRDETDDPPSDRGQPPSGEPLPSRRKRPREACGDARGGEEGPPEGGDAGGTGGPMPWEAISRQGRAGPSTRAPIGSTASGRSLPPGSLDPTRAVPHLFRPSLAAFYAGPMGGGGGDEGRGGGGGDDGEGADTTATGIDRDGGGRSDIGANREGAIVAGGAADRPACVVAVGGPAVLEGCLEAWPAMLRWRTPGYLRSVAGFRTVPVEVGEHYLAEGWGTRLMPLADFLDAWIEPGEPARPAGGDGDARGAARGGDGPGARSGRAGAGREEAGLEAGWEGGDRDAAPIGGAAAPGPELGYLAQHALFEQIPELRADVAEPEYCCLSSSAAPTTVNAWFGPEGTVTPAHHDPRHNFLCQVVGTKYVRLYAPDEGARTLYPHSSGMHTNSARVDVRQPDLGRFPRHGGAAFLDCELRPGQALFIPRGWWHYVQATSTSFSVSFWWD